MTESDLGAKFEAWAEEYGFYRELTDVHQYGKAVALDAFLACHALLAPEMRLLADTHTGMRVDYQGMLRLAQKGLRSAPAQAEMLRQLQAHMTELGVRWYAGDRTVVDEFLQLYCVEPKARAAIAAMETKHATE